jgi:hypothetical protein
LRASFPVFPITLQLLKILDSRESILQPPTSVKSEQKTDTLIAGIGKDNSNLRKLSQLCSVDLSSLPSLVRVPSTPHSPGHPLVYHTRGRFVKGDSLFYEFLRFLPCRNFELRTRTVYLSRFASQALLRHEKKLYHETDLLSSSANASSPQ